MMSRQIHLRQRPRGLPETTDFALVEVDLPEPGAGEVLVRNQWLSVDPAMRGRMYDAPSYVPHFALDAPLEGPAVGVVEASNSTDFSPGDLVYSDLGCRDLAVGNANQFEKLPADGLPPPAHLSVSGLPGLTAYVGLVRIAQLRPGDTVFISAASGAVGSVACQIAGNLGCRVIASAGGDAKVTYLRDELKVDAAIDYKAETKLARALAAAAPEGIDVYFDNVGGEHLEAAIAVANKDARFAICGMISQYNLTARPQAPANLTTLMTKGLRLQGFIVYEHLDLKTAFHAALGRWHKEGRIHWRETIRDGLESLPAALIGLFRGENLGKMLIRL